MPANRFWRTRGFPFLSDSAILIQLFHRLRALQVGTVPLTRNTYKPWTFISGNFADPLWSLRRKLTGHSNGMKSCRVGTNELHILLVSRRWRVGPESVVVRIGNWRLTLSSVPIITGYNEFCISNPWGKGGLGDVVVTKDWFIGRKRYRTMNLGNNIGINFYNFAANEL